MAGVAGNQENRNYKPPKAIVDTPRHFLRELTKPHVDSFNYFVGSGLRHLVQQMNANMEYCLIDLKGAEERLGYITAMLLPDTVRILPPNNTPNHARNRRIRYEGTMVGELQITLHVKLPEEENEGEILINKPPPKTEEHQINISQYLRTGTHKSNAKEKCIMLKDDIRKFNLLCIQHGFVEAPDDYDEDDVGAYEATELLWDKPTLPVILGGFPIMVGSRLCKTHGLDQKALRRLEEDDNDPAGYFIANGLEKVLRLLLVSRSNYIHCLSRPSFEKATAGGTASAAVIRCVTSAGLGLANRIQVNSNGILFWMFSRGTLFTIPAAIVLLACKHMSLQDLYQHLLTLDTAETTTPPQFDVRSSQRYAATNVILACRIHDESLKNFKDPHGKFNWTAYLGSLMVKKNVRWLPETPLISEDFELIGELVIRQYLFPHLNDPSITKVVPGNHGAEKSEKFNYFLYATKKLFDFTDGLIGPDSADATSNHELHTPDQLFAGTTWQSLTRFYDEIKRAWFAPLIKTPMQLTSTRKTLDAIAKAMRSDFCHTNRETFRNVNTLVNTGNYPAKQNRPFLVPQSTGFSVQGERINIYRFMSQLRSVHRGKQVEEMRTSIARKLPVEGWGFVCPVESPDGAPCGVLNHLTIVCEVSAYMSTWEDHQDDVQQLMNVLFQLGVHPVDTLGAKARRTLAPVIIDGRVIGYIQPHRLETTGKDLSIGSMLRMIKVLKQGNRPLPHHLEIAEIPFSPNTWCNAELRNQVRFSYSVLKDGTATSRFPQVDSNNPKPTYPGLYLFLTSGRLMRPTYNCRTQSTNFVGSLEQVFLHIACLRQDLGNLPAGVTPSLFDHCEEDPAHLLSWAASMIPFFEHNPSPRNLFQCQMMKQTMAISTIARKKRSDLKVYDLRTPQVPLVRTLAHESWHMDSNPIHTNAIVAVMSYSEYDMEDAIVVNKAAIQRGMFHGDIYKVYFIDLLQEYRKGKTFNVNNLARHTCFRIPADWDEHHPTVDPQGLPKIGTFVDCNTEWLSVCDCLWECEQDADEVADMDPDADSLNASLHEDNTRPGPPTAPSGFVMKYSNHRYYSFAKKDEQGQVEFVNVLERNKYGDAVYILVRLRIDRTPVIGDKFSSRHGQKGTLSLQFDETDMPFTHTGIIPDIMINPHAFPSRMTVGMMMELLVGKVGATKGAFQRTKAWRAFENDEQPMYHVYGQQLADMGLDYFGEEPMYSGMTGHQLQSHIFIGVCAYQRLRHLVMDKWQARETVGPTDLATLQPVKGRKRGGGIKVGEMERDALLAHGCAKLVTDRLFSVGKVPVTICNFCGSFLSLHQHCDSVPLKGSGLMKEKQVTICTACSNEHHFTTLKLPMAFVYLCSELFAMNIEPKLVLTTKLEPPPESI